MSCKHGRPHCSECYPTLVESRPSDRERLRMIGYARAMRFMVERIDEEKELVAVRSWAEAEARRAELIVRSLPVYP